MHHIVCVQKSTSDFDPCVGVSEATCTAAVLVQTIKPDQFTIMPNSRTAQKCGDDSAIVLTNIASPEVVKRTDAVRPPGVTVAAAGSPEPPARLHFRPFYSQESSSNVALGYLL